MDSIADRCLICYSIVTSTVANKKRKYGKRGGESLSSSSVLLQQLDNIFVLKELLEIPSHNLEIFLKGCGKPEMWISICPNCEYVIEEAKIINYEMIEVRKRFNSVKKQVIEAIRKSKAEQDVKADLKLLRKRKLQSTLITDESRSFVNIRMSNLSINSKQNEKCNKEILTLIKCLDEYGNFTDPFVSGDKRASQLIKKKRSKHFANNIPEGIEVKAELESTDCQGPCLDENKKPFFNLDLDLYEDFNETDIIETPNIDDNNENGESKHHEEKVADSHCMGGLYNNAKYCDTCEVHFVATMFEEHIKNLHETNALGAQSDLLPQTVAVATLEEIIGKQCRENITQEDPVHVAAEIYEENLVLQNNISKDAVKIVKKDSMPNASKITLDDDSFKETIQIKGKSVRRKYKCSSIALSCVKCTRKFYREDKFMEHQALHRTSPFHCFICLGVHKNSTSLRSHLCKQHSFANKQQSNEWTYSVTAKRNQNNTGIERLEADKDDFDWNPESEARNSNKRKQGKHDSQKCQRKGILTCSACKIFKFKVADLGKYIIHWKYCKGIAAVADNTSSKKVVTCQICNSFQASSCEQLEFFEHLLICNKNLTNDQQIPIKCRIFECSICPPKTYFTLDGFIQHFVEHRKNIYKCTKCPRRYPVINQIHLHWKSDHRDAVKNVKPSCRFSVDKSVPEICWWCHVCNQKFPNEDLRAEHIASAHESDVPEKIHICQQCSKAYSCKKELKLHKGTEHVKTNVSVFECDVCKMRFATSNQLKNHRMRKHRLDLLVCDVCGKECNSVFTLNKHMQLHLDVKNFPCQECDKSFTTPQYLRNHKFQVHTPHDAQINPLVCPFCQKAFYSKPYLNEHIAGIHEGRFTIFCNLCPAGFFHNSQLKEHLAKKHKIGEAKTYPCTEEGCDKKFHSRKKLRDHIDRHTGNPQYKCRFCPKEFYDSGHLQRHEKIHTNAESKPYVCEICAKRFPVRNYLYIHMKSHKKENK